MRAAADNNDPRRRRTFLGFLACLFVAGAFLVVITVLNMLLLVFSLGQSRQVAAESVAPPSTWPRVPIRTF